MYSYGAVISTRAVECRPVQLSDSSDVTQLIGARGGLGFLNLTQVHFINPVQVSGLGCPQLRCLVLSPVLPILESRVPMLSLKWLLVGSELRCLYSPKTSVVHTFRFRPSQPSHGSFDPVLGLRVHRQETEAEAEQRTQGQGQGLWGGAGTSPRLQGAPHGPFLTAFAMKSKLLILQWEHQSPPLCLGVHLRVTTGLCG